MHAVIQRVTGSAATGVRGSNRVNRGGSWNNSARNARVANRNNDDPGNRNDNLGLRLVSSTPRSTSESARTMAITVSIAEPGY